MNHLLMTNMVRNYIILNFLWLILIFHFPHKILPFPNLCVLPYPLNQILIVIVSVIGSNFQPNISLVLSFVHFQHPFIVCLTSLNINFQSPQGFHLIQRLIWLLVSMIMYLHFTNSSFTIFLTIKRAIFLPHILSSRN